MAKKTNIPSSDTPVEEQVKSAEVADTQEGQDAAEQAFSEEQDKLITRLDEILETASVEVKKVEELQVLSDTERLEKAQSLSQSIASTVGTIDEILNTTADDEAAYKKALESRKEELEGHKTSMDTYVTGNSTEEKTSGSGAFGDKDHLYKNAKKSHGFKRRF